MERKDYDLLVFLTECKRHVGKLYEWGGQEEAQDYGIDCSGIPTNGFRANGMFTKHQDASAKQLYKRFWKGNSEVPTAGALVFFAHDWNDPDTVYHVCVCITPYHVITADGGGSTVKTEEAAKKRNAFVRVLPIDHRGNDYRVVNPFVS